MLPNRGVLLIVGAASDFLGVGVLPNQGGVPRNRGWGTTESGLGYHRIGGVVPRNRGWGTTESGVSIEKVSAKQNRGPQNYQGI